MRCTRPTFIDEIRQKGVFRRGVHDLLLIHLRGVSFVGAHKARAKAGTIRPGGENRSNVCAGGDSASYYNRYAGDLLDDPSKEFAPRSRTAYVATRFHALCDEQVDASVGRRLGFVDRANRVE
jgi:hypothetical protein